MPNIMGIYTLPTVCLILYLMLMPLVSYLLKKWDANREMKILLDAKKGAGTKKNQEYKRVRDYWKEHIKYANRDNRHVAFKLIQLPPWLLAIIMPKPDEDEEQSAEAPKDTFELPQVQRRWITWGIFLAGAAAAFCAPLTTMTWQLLLTSLSLWALYIIISLTSPKWFLGERAKANEKLIVCCTDDLKIPAEDARSHFVVNSWDEETNLEPTNVTFTLPKTFPPKGGPEKAVLERMNATLTNTRTYILDESDGPGLDTKDFKLKVRAKPPMPTIATFDPFYIFADGIEAGAFAIGFGDSGGAEITTPDGKTNVVMYVNMSGKAESYARKYGLTMVAPATPMVLIMGPTGSGKAQALTDKILRIQFWVVIDGVKTIVEGIPYDPDNPEAPQPEWTQWG